MCTKALTKIQYIVGSSILLVLVTGLNASAQRERPDRPDHGAAGTKAFERPDATDTVRLDTPERVGSFFDKQTRKFQDTPKEPLNSEFRANLAFITSSPTEPENISAAKTSYRTYLEKTGRSSNRVKPLSFGRYLETYFIAKNPQVSNKVSFEELIEQVSRGKKPSEVLRSRGLNLKMDNLVMSARQVSKQYQM